MIFNFPQRKMTSKEPSFSVIMTVFDNARELEANLPAFLQQDYEPGYKVIVVDETSTDDTEDVLKILKQQNNHLYTTFLPKPDPHVTRRKLALTIGVKAATGNWIILTDITTPTPSADWLKDIAGVIDDNTGIVFGYYAKKGLCLQTFESIEEGSQFIRKAERKHAFGHRGKLFRYQRGLYDFIAMPSSQAHQVLSFFEQDINSGQLCGLRLSIACRNLFIR